MMRSKWLFLTVAMTCGSVGVVFGNPVSTPSSMSTDGACQADTAKYCSGAETPKTELGACLQQHSVELSTACRESVTPFKPEWQKKIGAAEKSGAACQGDIERFCEGVQVGKGRIEKCLKSHRSKLTPECRAAQGLK